MFGLGLMDLGGHSSHTDRKFQLDAWGKLQSLAGQESKIGKSEVAAGQGGLDSAMKYFQSLLSGDRSKIAGAIAPAVSTLTNQSQQERQTQSEFGNRSGGTNAANQQTTERVSGEITNLINSLIPDAAKELGTLGTAREGLGLESLGLSGSLLEALSAQAGHSKEVAQGSEAQIGQDIGQLIALAATA